MNKNHVLIWIVLFTLPFLQGFGCGDNRLKVINTSDNDLYIFFSCDKNLDEQDLARPGYWVDPNGDSLYIESSDYVKADSSINLIMRGSWPNFFKSCNGEKVYFMFITDSILIHSSDQEIIDKELYEYQLGFTLKEIINNNWIINVP
jgi:hypothetical protein